MAAKASTRKAIFDALDRLAAGKSKRTDGQLTAENLAVEAGVGRATLYRCPEALGALEQAKAGRAAAKAAPPSVPMRSTERELRDAVRKLANRILLLQKEIEGKDAEIARLRNPEGDKVVPFGAKKGISR